MTAFHRSLMLLCAFFALTLTASADTVTYHFDFSNLNNGAEDFSLELQSNGYMTTTGLVTLSTPLATPFSFDITRAGTSNDGWFLFASDLVDLWGASLTNDSASFSSESFLFSPNAFFNDGYIQAPGIYSGNVSGNAGLYFISDAVLTVSTQESTAVTPEPASLLLLSTGAMAAAAGLRRRVRVAA